MVQTTDIFLVSGSTNLESFPGPDVSEFDFHPEEEDTNESGQWYCFTLAVLPLNRLSENQTNLDPNVDLSVTENHDPETAEYEPEVWDNELDGDGEPDTLWENQHEQEQETASNQSSITLSSNTSSKRSISEAELEEEYQELRSSPHSPGW